MTTSFSGMRPLLGLAAALALACAPPVTSSAGTVPHVAKGSASPIRGGTFEASGVVRVPGTNGSYGGRPSPEVEERVTRLKAVRNARAAALGIDRGTLLSNAVLQLIAESPPATPDGIARVAGIRRWQAGLLARELLNAL